MTRQVQIGRCHWHGRARQWLKRQANRARRRAEKRDPEGAPVKNRYIDYVL